MNEYCLLLQRETVQNDGLHDKQETNNARCRGIIG